MMSTETFLAISCQCPGIVRSLGKSNKASSKVPKVVSHCDLNQNVNASKMGLIKI